jgi:hypothetical protein
MTAQAHENLILNGKETTMAFCPPIPENDPRVKLTLGDFSTLSSSCDRGYVGTWEIKADKFYLVKLKGDYNFSSDTPVLADWFTGVLRIPEGDLLHYEHIGFASVFERESHIKIEEGSVVKSKTIDNRNQDIDKTANIVKNVAGYHNLFDGDDL